MEYVVEKEWAEREVLELIRRKLNVSGTTLRHLKFLENGILLNGKRVTVRAIAHEGDLLALATDDTAPQENLSCVELPLPILYEDADLVVPDKPADMPTHPSHGHREDTVANALAFRYEKQGIPFVFRPINRLDRNTSGLLLIARNRLSASTLSASMRNGQIRKQYLAVLDGVPTSDEGIIDTHIRRTAASIIVRENCAEGEGGDRAVTHYRVLAQTETHALVAAAPITGRTHQLRVHFAGIGCPILGDDMYGVSSEWIGRHALHAHVLSFPHPSTKEMMTLTAPLHEDMARVIRCLFPTFSMGESSPVRLIDILGS